VCLVLIDVGSSPESVLDQAIEQMNNLKKLHAFVVCTSGCIILPVRTDLQLIEVLNCLEENKKESVLCQRILNQKISLAENTILHDCNYYIKQT